MANLNSGTTGSRQSIRLKEKQASGGKDEENDTNSNASKVQKFLNSEVAVKRRRSRSVAVNESDQEDIVISNELKLDKRYVAVVERKERKSRGKKKADVNNLKELSKSDRKRAHSLSKSQQRIDLLLFRSQQVTSNANRNLNLGFLSQAEHVNNSKVAAIVPGGNLELSASTIAHVRPDISASINKDEDGKINRNNTHIPSKDLITPEGYVINAKTTGDESADEEIIFASTDRSQSVNATLRDGSQASVLKGKNSEESCSIYPQAFTMEEMFKILCTKIDDAKTDIKADNDRMIQEVKTEIATLRSDNTAIRDDLASVKTENVSLRKELKEIKEDMKTYKNQVRNLTSVVAKHDSTLAECKRESEFNAFQEMRNNLIICGIQENSDENVKQVVKNFFKNTLKIEADIAVISARRMNGTGRDRAISVILQRAQDKGIIYKNTPNLKDVVNHVNRPYRIDDQLPGRFQEQKQRMRKLRYKNDKVQGAGEKLDMTMKKGKLFIGSQQYTKMVKKPSVFDRVNLDGKAMKPAFQIHRGATIQVETSSFVGYSTAVRAIAEVNAAYIEVQNLEPESRHVMCGYRIPGREFHVLQDFESDDEHNGGQVILRLLERSNIVNRAVFVARIYDGKHIGNKRYDAIEDAAKSAINRSTFNEVTREHQFPWEEQQWAPGQTSTRGRNHNYRGGAYPKYGRGGGVPPNTLSSLPPGFSTNTDSEGWENANPPPSTDPQYNWDEVDANQRADEGHIEETTVAELDVPDNSHT